MPGPHAPSLLRRIQRQVRAAKDGRGPSAAQVADEVQAIDDPAYRASAWVHLMAHPHLEPPNAPLRRVALRGAASSFQAVPQDWRAFEVAEQAWRHLDPRAPDARALRRTWLEHLVNLPDSEAVAEGIATLALRADEEERAVLWTRAARLGDGGIKPLKAVLRHALRADDADADPGRAAVWRARAEALEDPEVRSALLAYHARLTSKGRIGDDQDADEAAAAALADIKSPSERLEALHRSLQGIASVDRLTAYLTAVTTWPEPAARADASVRIAGAYDRMGDARRALGVLERARAMLDEVHPALERAKIAGKWAACRARVEAPDPTGSSDETDGARDAAAFLADVLQDLPQDETYEQARKRLTKALEKHGMGDPRRAVEDEVEPDWRQALREGDTGEGAPGGATEPADTGGRHVLALTDCYAGLLGKAHVQAIARAAPLCDAFDLDLVLFGFPSEDLEDLVRRAADDTNIGGGRRHVARLHEQGRIRLMRAPPDGPPLDWDTLGVPVVTTPRPAPRRRVELDEVAAQVAPRPLLLVMGLGRQGLPMEWLHEAPHHYEITGREVHLETATAMGILADRLGRLPRPDPPA